MMNSKKKVLLQCQSLTYLYTGLASILTKYSIDEVNIDIFFTKNECPQEFLNYIKMNEVFQNLYLINSSIYDKINKKLFSRKVNFFNKIYFNCLLKKDIATRLKKQLDNNDYSEVFYSEGGCSFIYLTIAYPNAHFVMYGDGSGLIYNPSNSKLIDFNQNTSEKRLYKLKSPDEIIALAPYKKDDSVDITGVPISATNPQILLDIINRDKEIQHKVDDFANSISSDFSQYDKKILLLPSRLEDKRFCMQDDDQINIYVDIINKYTTDNSLVILKPHPTSKINLLSSLREKCSCKIIDIPDDLKPLPVETYVNLLNQMDKIITFLSSSKVSLKAIFNIDALDEYDVIQNYPLKERVNIDLKVFSEVCKRFDNWDKKSIVYECDVLPEYKKFYQKYSKPVFVPRKNTFSENIFSIRNIGTTDEKRKQLTILGLKFKFKSSKKIH